MKKIGRICSALLLVFLLCTLTPPCRADYEEYRDKEFEEVIADFLEDIGMNESRIGVGYKNLVTGEEYFINADEYRIAASMYKVPLNMVFAERVYEGEMEMDSMLWAFPYSQLQYSSIVNSSNDAAQTLWENLGDYTEYRRLIAPIMGEDPDTVDKMFYVNNYFTPRQMLHCMELLYNEQERYPGVVDCMLQAAPEKFFRGADTQYEIAQKYGYLIEDDHTYLNCCGLIWTDDPIALVVFTDTFPNRATVLADFVTRIIDWTECRYELRTAAEEQLAEEEEQLSTEAEEPQTEYAAEAVPYFSREEKNAYIIAASAAAAALVLVIIKRRRIGTFFAMLSVLLTAAAVCVCIFGVKHGTVILEAEGDPEDTVTEFFDSVSSGSYERAYDCLYGCSGLGLGGEQTDDTVGRISAALAESYSWQAGGEMMVSGLTAERTVLFTHLDIEALNKNISSRIQPVLEAQVEELEIEEIYDEEGNYLPSFTEEIYNRAVNEALAEAESFRTTETLKISLISKDGKWYITPDQSLITALCGGIL